jgi:D-beta-D-heptose 7-phosphate kinase/D-beta-D-heptose 1-phosphate adenosyltransferase
LPTKAALSPALKRSLIALLNRLANRKIAVIGDVMLDVYVRGAVGRISPEAPIPIVEIRDKDVKLPGGAANVAANVASLGGSAALIGIIGRDPSGRDLARELKRRHVDISGLLAVQDRPTTEKIRVIGGAQQLVRLDREVTAPISEQHQAQLIDHAVAAVRRADGVIFEDYNKGVLTPRVIRSVMSSARRLHKVVTVDPKFRNFFEFKGATVIKPNMKEVVAALGTDGSGELETVGAKILQRTGCGAVVLTRSEHGMTLFERRKPPITIPTLAREVFDVSGAGDTVIATLTLALAAGASLLQAAALANYAAGIEVEKLGVATVSIAELRARLEDEVESS